MHLSDQASGGEESREAWLTVRLLLRKKDTKGRRAVSCVVRGPGNYAVKAAFQEDCRVKQPYYQSPESLSYRTLIN